MTGSTLLLVNKFYHDVGPAGGVGRYLLQEEQDLSAAGWQVVPFAMADASTRDTPWSGYFVTARDYRTPRWNRGTLGDALSLLWNREAARHLDALLGAVRPAIAHLHNIYHHLSPSVLPVLARHGVPVVMTLHDLRLLCPAIHMFRQGEVCERCRGGRFWQAVAGRCVKDSRAASLAAIETAHQHLRRLYQRHVELMLCPSRFYLEKYAEWGYPRDKLMHLPNFVDTEFWRPLPALSPQSAAAYLYFGRLSREKGLTTLLQAQSLWEKLGAGGAAAGDAAAGGAATRGAPSGGAPPMTLLIAGSGPAEDQLRRQASELGLQRCEFLGSLDTSALRDVLGRVRFTVIPSQWYENAPMAILESLAAGRPVLGTRIGGITELIDDGQDGVLVAPGDPRALCEGLQKAASLPPEAGARARSKVVKTASRRVHMERLAQIFTDVAARHQRT
jgi:glycosyltransferase involved in cell wall biosynthesis